MKINFFYFGQRSLYLYKKRKMSSESVRLNKAISDSGLCSRRQADEWIEKGRVSLNGKTAQLGDRVRPEDEVRVDGKLIPKTAKPVYILLNKPVGITCTTNRRFDDNVIDFVNHSERIYPVGRLDKPSEGLLLMTNDGTIVNKILRAANEHEKEYIVAVNRSITDDFIDRMQNGIPILDTVTKKCEVEKINEFTFRIVLVQGLNRQIRRMCDYLNYKVVSLKRIRLINLELGKLPTGKWRNLTEKELKDLMHAIRDSQIHPGYRKDSKKLKKESGNRSEKKSENYKGERTFGKRRRN